MTTRALLDLSAIAAASDLRALVEATCGPPSPSGRFHCPRHDDASPSLYLWADGRRWRCWPCGAQGDALDFVAWVEGIDLAEAARRLDLARIAGRGRVPATRVPREAVGRPSPPWHAMDWQTAVERLVGHAEAALWSPAGRSARNWLQARGLEDHTIRRFRMGYLGSEGWTSSVRRPDGTASGLRHERGILLPWAAPGACYDPSDQPAGPGRWCGANVRRLADDPFEPLPDDEPKCRALRGSERGHFYPWPDIQPSQGHPPALIVEGELDALIGVQEASHLVAAGTVGGATQEPHHSSLTALACCPWWLIATDHDAAGVEAARRWRNRAPHKSRRMILPHGKDLAEFHAAGGDVLAWLADEIGRLGIVP